MVSMARGGSTAVRIVPSCTRSAITSAARTPSSIRSISTDRQMVRSITVSPGSYRPSIGPGSARAGVILRPALQHGGRVVLVDVAGIQLEGLFRQGLAGIARLARAVGGLERGRAE